MAMEPPATHGTTILRAAARKMMSFMKLMSNFLRCANQLPQYSDISGYATDCYFVVWSPTEQVTLKVDYDSGFIEAALDKALLFFKHGLLPELLGRWYTRLETIKSLQSVEADRGCNDDEWCYCGGSETLGDMIGCDNPSCSIKWFHMNCLGIDSIPEGEWYCPNCC